MNNIKNFSDFINESQEINEGTRSQFGKIDRKGNITSVYMHYDGYPENVLPILKRGYKGGKNVDAVKPAVFKMSPICCLISAYSSGVSFSPAINEDLIFIKIANVSFPSCPNAFPNLHQMMEVQNMFTFGMKNQSNG